MKRNDATETQIRAAIPDRSTWVEANAGSGKTRVLTDRVARLLLEGVQPQHILCLTYTKAAASEMQNRLFQRLGEWAMMNSRDLTDSLQDLGVERVIDDPFLRQSRRLFAQAIEAPGGLKIQTIHSFCSSLLRRFPREAQVSPQFTEIEGRTSALLRQEVVDHMAMSEHKPLVDGLAQHYTGEDFEALTAEILKHADRVGEKDKSGIWDAFGLRAGETRKTVSDKVFMGDEGDILNALIPLLLASGTNDQKAGHALKRVATGDFGSLPILENVLLFGAKAKEPFSAKVGKFPTKALCAANPELIERLNGLMLRVEDARNTRLSLLAAEKTCALHRFAKVFISLYSSRKQALGYLDFDDLILRARDLLTDPAVAQWVLFRLDGGIDHILVDEAQDTSPVQWAVIERLAQEFTSGEGARAGVTRTLFVVGDKKQSIYSFQGADPGAFDRMRDEFGKRLRAVNSDLYDVPMSFSFRSSPAVLNMVDYSFQAGLEDAIGQSSNHRAFNSDLPGRVDLWPRVAYVSDEDDKNWSEPVDLPGQKNHKVVLAHHVADEIKRLTQEETLPVKDKDTGEIYRRQVRPGDIMVLVRGRTGGLFHQIIQACKSRDLPIAGADRLKVGAELAVRDLAALLSFLALQEDDLSLATALKSPLFGWSEQALYTLAHGRNDRRLWQVLRERGDQHPKTMAVLNDLRDKADFLRPYELIERILTRHDGRLNLLGRLGQEAEDGINALLAQALAYEQASTPSLTGFLVWMQEDALEIKRQMESGGDLIRVMTVHGSKGLEAPIVILPQTTPPQNDVKDEIFPTGDGLFWKTRSEDMPEIMRAAKDALLEKRENEHMRLLYVAMTRAEKWLIVAGVEQKKGSGRGWYDVVSTGMEHAGGVAQDFPTGQGLRYAVGDWAGGELRSDAQAKPALPELPPWAGYDAPEIKAATETLSPSDLGGAKALASDLGMDDETAKAYGSAVHALLEHLPAHPRTQWPEIAGRLVDESFAKAALQEATAVLHAHPDLFTPDTLAEISLTADLPFGRIHGTIDRLIVAGDRVTAIDFKSNRAVPIRAEDTPQGLLRQMGAYAAALAKIYPSYEIHTEILWTATGVRMPVPDMLIDEALQSLDPP
ncbi:MAG: double-strand break repair helicase AddA [Paracoccaceae bacterium]|jgi:ATP-dependent helicase/nuclease subunit A|nr:double-strand break repair helicase AddA [Paracoccaceae bacterium]MDP7186132.1 double-strand break repair helicase AddA [Paracoccaceae bacterium]